MEIIACSTWLEFYFILVFFFFFFRAAPMAYEVPRLGVESELQLLAYATATAIQIHA